jgi:proteasome lid subunit RPN8/RPN11
MEEIRAFTCDNLLQLSHGGNEVAGVLFGTRRDDLIRILTWRPIACEHKDGQGLQLSYNDRMNLAVQLEMARRTPDLKELRPVGWFVSHSRGAVSLSPADVEIYNSFFPESWQVMLVICPQGNSRAQAGFFAREAEDKLQSDASYQCFDLEPLGLAPDAIAEEAQPAPALPPVQPVPAANPAAQDPPAQDVPAQDAPEPTVVPINSVEVGTSPEPPEPVLAEPSEPAPPVPAKAFEPAPVVPAMLPEPAPLAPAVLSEPVPLVRAAVASRRNFDSPSFETPGFESPSFEVTEQVPTHERWLWAIPVLLALGIAAFLLYQRRVPSPSASIGLHAVAEAQTVQLAWDGNARAIRDADRGEIEISDGGKSSQVSLTSDQLQAGKLSYLPQSSDVSFVLTVHPADGEPIHDSTRLVAPTFSVPRQPPQLLPAAPSPAAAPPVTPPAPASTAQSELAQQVQQLKADVSKERARADELQNLVRILENRLGIQHEAPSAQRRP